MRTRSPSRAHRSGRSLISRRAAAAIGAAVVGACAISARAVNVTDTWLSATNGTWSDATKWSAGVPNNGVDTYSVTIGATGSPYTVTLNTNVTINDLTLNSANAILEQTAGTFSVVNSAINLQAGTYRIAAGTLSNSTISFGAGGSLNFGGGARFNNVAVNGSINLSAAVAILGVNGATFTGAVNLTGSSTVLGFFDSQTISATTYNLDGAFSNLSLEGVGTLTIPAGALVRGGNGGGFSYGFITGGNTNRLVNNGTIQADLAGKAFILASSGNNSFTNNGTLAAINGATLSVNTPTWSSGATAAILTSGASTINLGGSFTGANLLTNVTRAGGTININGTLNNTGNTLAFTATTGDWWLNSGTISGGSITNSVGGALRYPANVGGRYVNGVTHNGSLTIDQSSAKLGVSSDSTITGDVNLTGGSAVIGFFDTRTLPAVTFNLDGAGSNLSLEGLGTLTIPATGTVRGGNNGGISYGFFTGGNTSGLVNNGTIQADLAGKTFLMVSSANNFFTNNGTLAAINGATLAVNTPTWSSGATSAIKTSGASMINLGGSFTSANLLANVTRAGGTININGTLNNTGNTLAFTATTGDWMLSGGTISGGTVTNSAGGSLRYTLSGGRLSGVTVIGSLSLNTTSARVAVSNGGSISGAANLSGDSTILGFFDTTTLPVTTYNIDGFGAYLSTEGTGTTTVPAGAVIRGGNNSGIWYGFVSGGVSNGFVNNGTIRADITGKTFTVFPSGSNVFTNNGLLEAINGATLTISAATWSNSATGSVTAASGSTVIFGSNWSSAGTANVNGGNLILAGSFSTAAGLGTFSRTGTSTIVVTGNWNNTGSSFTFNTTTGNWVLGGGSITGGSLNFSGGSLTVGNGVNSTLNNVTVNGDLTLTATSTRLYVLGASTFNGAVNVTGTNNILGFNGAQTISPTTYNIDGSGAYLTTEGVGTLTIPAGALVRGGNGGGIYYGFINNQASTAFNTVVNNGTVRADVNAGSFTVFPGGSNTFVNNGTMAAANGGKLIVNGLSGNVNNINLTGLGSTIRISGIGTYTLNVPVAVLSRSTLNLQGSWNKAANIDASGRIIFDYPTAGPSVFSTIRGQIITGRNGGLWNGPGIFSSAAAATPRTAVGYGEASTVLGISGGAFSGEPVDGTAVLVRWTWVGDANLDGDTDGVDIGTWATNFTGELSGGPGATFVWTQGDWDYDGDVDGVDAGLWATAFTGELSGGGLGSVVVTDPALSREAAEILQGLGITVIPEPAAFIVTCVGLTGLATCRRRRRIS